MRAVVRGSRDQRREDSRDCSGDGPSCPACFVIFGVNIDSTIDVRREI